MSASGVKAEMDELIQSKPVLLVSKSYCPFCKKAKQVLVKYKRNTNTATNTNTNTNTNTHINTHTNTHTNTKKNTATNTDTNILKYKELNNIEAGACQVQH